MADKEMRAVYAQTLIELANENDAIMVVEADLMKATGTTAFKKVHPTKTIDVGVAEANMVGVAAGLSEAGKIPFAATFGCFAARRTFDQFFLSANYAKLNVKLVGTDPGVTAAFNGGTHMPFEDIGIMRNTPGLTIIEPSDPVSLKALVQEAAKLYGCVYMRLPRKNATVIYDENETFELGKAKVLREGKDALIITLGAVLTQEALKAAEELAKEGIEVTIIDALTVKPLDKELIVPYIQKIGKVVTAENHQVSTGLGGAVSELIADNGIAVKMKKVGVHDEFGEVGTQAYLQERFGMTAANIIEQVKAVL